LLVLQRDVADDALRDQVCQHNHWIIQLRLWGLSLRRSDLSLCRDSINDHASVSTTDIAIIAMMHTLGEIKKQSNGSITFLS
jgi:hypothetical protein